MDIVQFILIGLFLFPIFAIIFVQKSRLGLLGRFGFIFITISYILAVIFPDKLSYLASFLGVGRGADLILYLNVTAFLVFCLLTINKFISLEIKFVKLISLIAVKEANQKYK